MPWTQEELTGTKNGVNVTFAISATPVTNSLMVIFNSGELYEDATPDTLEYSISGTTITLGIAPNANDRVWAIYETP